MIRCSKCHINYTTSLICVPCLDEIDEQKQAESEILSGKEEIKSLEIKIKRLKTATRKFLSDQTPENKKNLEDVLNS